MKKTMKTMMLAAAVALAGMAAFAAGSDATWEELTGSTSGKTLSTGYYFIRANTIFSNTTAGGSGLSIADNAVVYIYIPEGVTLTATGAAGSGTTGGGAGIHLPETSALYLIGSGKVKATGGKAADGSDGKDGEMPRESYASIYPFSEKDRIVYASCWSGTGGAGGAGGGGAGAGIGTPGGTGGAGGAGGVGFGENGTDRWTTEIQRGNAVWTGGVYSGNGRAGVAGCAGSAAQTMGTLSIQSTIIQEISGGAASATAGTYVKNAANVRTGLGGNAIAGVEYRFYAYPGAGGGGGGSGSAGANIGTGGGGGGGGAGGQAGGVCIKQGTHTADWPQSYVGGGGTGNKNGTGSTSSSKIVKAINESSIEDSYGGINKPADVNAVRYGGTGAGTGTAKAAGTADAPVYAVTYLDKDGKACGSATYAVGSTTKIALPVCEAGCGWVNTVCGKPCGEPSDLSVASDALLMGTINARNVYGNLTFKAEANSNWEELTGGTSGRTLESGYYFISANTTFSNTTAGGSGLSIADNAVVYIYIPADVTLTATGAAGSGKTGGGAGIHVPSSATLNLIGSGTVNATGGNAADGSKGEMGKAFNHFEGQSHTAGDDWWFTDSGAGGAGGAGGGGAGAGIGTAGGAGGNGGAGGAGLVRYGFKRNIAAYAWNTGTQTTVPVAGDNGSAALAMGGLSVQSSLTLTAVGGSASSVGGAHGDLNTQIGWGEQAGFHRWEYDGGYLAGYWGAPGGGGGSGYGAANIGTGGGGGGGGSGGQGGAVEINFNGGYKYPISYGGRGGTGAANGGGSVSASNYVQNFVKSGVTYNKPDFNTYTKAGGAGADAGAEKAAGTAEAPVYAVAYLDKDGAACGTATYAVGSATSITLPACEAGYKWVNTVYGKPCGSPSDLSSAPVAAFTGTINARNVYGDLTFKATKDGEEGNPWSVGGNVVAYMDGTGGLVVSGTGATGDFSKKNPAPWAAFADQIRSVTIEPGVTQIGSRFFKGCTRLGTVTGGKDLISVGENAFYQCMSLETIKLDNADVLDSLKNAIVYQTAIKEDGSLYTIPAITLPNCESVLYGTNDLSDPNSWQPVDSNKTMQASGYHFFKFVLKKIGE